MSAHRPPPPSDPRFIGALGPFIVAAAHHEVMLRDGSLHALHHVLRRGVPCQHLRALRADDRASFQVVDLCALAPVLAGELPATLERDRPGLITYTLRALYPTGAALRRSAADTCDLAGATEPFPATAFAREAA